MILPFLGARSLTKPDKALLHSQSGEGSGLLTAFAPETFLLIEPDTDYSPSIGDSAETVWLYAEGELLVLP